jgi:ATP-dependent Clp protease ATP-binding subunit ClpX
LSFEIKKLIDNMKFIKILASLMLVMVCSAFTMGDKGKGVYMAGVSASFTDSLVHFTGVQFVDSVMLDKDGMLPYRDQYSDQLDSYLEYQQGLKNRICFIYFDVKKEKVEKGVYKDVIAHDVVKYGIIPELVGRLPVIVALDNLDESALVRILKEPKNAVFKQYQKLFEMDGMTLEFEDEAFNSIAKLAIERNTGARGLRSIIESIMMQPMYDLPGRDDVSGVIVTPGFIEGKEELKLIFK